MSIRKYPIYQRLLSLALAFCLVLPLFGCQEKTTSQPATAAANGNQSPSQPRRWSG